jgi:hypothetical protein
MTASFRSGSHPIKELNVPPRKEQVFGIEPRSACIRRPIAELVYFFPPMRNTIFIFFERRRFCFRLTRSVEKFEQPLSRFPRLQL